MPEYETISYVWGDPNLKATVYVNGRGALVPASPERVLRRMRLPVRIRVLWIDALCIKQDDLQEKQQQVAIMGEIYW